MDRCIREGTELERMRVPIDELVKRCKRPLPTNKKAPPVGLGAPKFRARLTLRLFRAGSAVVNAMGATRQAVARPMPPTGFYLAR
jgi:hypothetical protein